jgi:hypothetical protein
MHSEAIATILEGGVISNADMNSRSGVIASMIYAANDGDIPKTFNAIAESLTNQIRSGPQTINHTGYVWRTEIYMRVDRSWLAYPVALLTVVRIKPIQITCVWVLEKANCILNTRSRPPHI